MNDLLGQNLAALRQISHVDLSRAPAATPHRSLVTGTGEGLRLRTPDGREVRLGSARNPRGEAEALLAAALGNSAQPDAVVVIGGGTGAILEVLETMPVRRIVVIEPVADLAVPWLSSRSWVDVIRADRLRLIVGPDYVGVADAARFLEGVDRLPVVAHPVLAREYPVEMAAGRRALDRVMRDALANANARQRFEDLAVTNTLRNLPALAGGANVEALFELLTGVPAIIVGAGPSLDANLAAIRDVQDRAIVFATDTALLPCLGAGIVPPFVVSLDPSEANGRHLVACGAATETHLVTEASVDPAGVETFTGRTFVFRVGDHAPWPWLLAGGVSRARLSVWGSVATAALDLALKAGCRAIAFAGLDLAYTAGRPYCRGTVLEESWAWAVARGQTLQEHWDLLASTRSVVDEPDVGGHLVSSAAHLLAFRDWIQETVVAHPEVRFANATGAGILHGPRLAQQPLSDFIDGYPLVGRTAFVSKIRAAYEAARSPAIGRHLAAQLAQARPRDILRGHSAADRVASELVRPDLLQETVRRLETSRPDASGIEPSVTFTARPRIHLPEQTALLNALTSGAAGGETSTREPDRERALALLRDAYDQLVALTPRAHGVRSPHRTDELITLWHRVPARLLFAWPHGLADAVEAFGSRLAEAIPVAGAQRDLPPLDVPATGDSLWCEGALDLARATTSDPEPQLAPAALLWQWALVYALTLAPDSFLASSMRKLLDAPPLLVPANGPVARLTAWLEGPAPSGEAPLLPWLSGVATARALSGLIATRGSAGADRPRDANLRVSLSATGADLLTNVCAIEPESLVARGHPRAHNIAAASNREVLVGRSDGSAIAVMSESGRLVRLETWPLPVRASIPYGTDGRLAWHFPDAPRLLHRHRTTGQVDVIELPVTVIDALERPDGSVLLATDDGLWTWRPDGVAEPLVRGPWLVSLWAHGSGVHARVRPGRGQEGRWDAATAILAWQPGDRTFQTIAVTPGTAPFAVSEHAGWRAEAWLDGGVIRLVRADDRVFWMACGAPRSLAWAGPTLYVANIAGEVLRFPDVAARLAKA